MHPACTSNQTLNVGELHVSKKRCSCCHVLLTAEVSEAAPVSYSFDSISAMDFGRPNVTITGVLRNASTPTAVTFADANSDYTGYANRCVPLLLTMMEKPGRYYFNLTVDADMPYVSIVNYGLELRS